MLKYKKAIAIALFGIGLGASASAMARAGLETCRMWMQQCDAGDEEACELYERQDCWWWHL
ncbi:hypothetical protein [Pseudoduganella sp.]|uniref:hypothetical protein n=1 Tax=Pseudoduganella sp. TaxID=1880898 RepID=UPI0035B1A782